jgi:hypothetical protein
MNFITLAPVYPIAQILKLGQHPVRADVAFPLLIAYDPVIAIRLAAHL